MPLQNLNYDPSFYYAHIRSPVIDGDIDFSNDGLPPYLVATRTSTGLAPSVWSVGPALVWAPFFLLAHAMTLLGRLVNLPLSADGYNPLYLTLCALGSAFIGWVGTVWCYLIARRFTAHGPSLIAAIGVWLTSPLFYYMYKNPLMSHAPTVAFTSAVIYLWLRIVDDPQYLWPWFLLGILIGCATLMRWQNALLALIVPFTLLFARRFWSSRYYALQRYSLTLAGSLIGFMPQMIIWWRLYGKPLTIPQSNSKDFLRWLHPEIFQVLLSSNRGLFIWQPLALIGCLGLLFFAARYRRLGVAIILVILLELYLNSTVRDWWGGGGFGPRRFDWMIPFMVLGVALIIQQLWTKQFARIPVLFLIACLFFYNIALVQAHYYRVLPQGQAFPIADYDDGRALASNFMIRVLFGAFREPTFFVETKPTLWSTAIPPIHTLFNILRGKAPDMQVLATGMATVLAVGLVILFRLIIIRIYCIARSVCGYASLIRQMSAVILISLVTADLVFLYIGS